MCKRRDYLLAVSTTLVFLFIAFVCDAQTIRSQRKLNLLDGRTGVITDIGDTRVTISFQDPSESLTVHVRDASDLKVGDFVKMEGGRPVKMDAPAEPPKPAGTQKVEESPPAPEKAAPPPQPGPSEASKPGPDAKK